MSLERQHQSVLARSACRALFNEFARELEVFEHVDDTASRHDSIDHSCTRRCHDHGALALPPTVGMDFLHSVAVNTQFTLPSFSNYDPKVASLGVLFRTLTKGFQ